MLKTMNLFKSIKNFIKRMLSSKDDISANRTIGTLAFFTLVGIMILGLWFKRVEVDKFQIAVEYMFYLIVILFLCKSGEKISDILSNIWQKKSKNSSDSE